MGQAEALTLATITLCIEDTINITWSLHITIPLTLSRRLNFHNVSRSISVLAE